jgi:hypothetical protein
VAEVLRPAPLLGENSPIEISRSAPLNQGVHSFGVPALAGPLNDPPRSPDRLTPGLQAGEVHGEGKGEGGRHTI